MISGAPTLTDIWTLTMNDYLNISTIKQHHREVDELKADNLELRKANVKLRDEVNRLSTELRRREVIIAKVVKCLT